MLPSLSSPRFSSYQTSISSSISMPDQNVALSDIWPPSTSNSLRDLNDGSRSDGLVVVEATRDKEISCHAIANPLISFPNFSPFS